MSLLTNFLIHGSINDSSQLGIIKAKGRFCLFLENLIVFHGFEEEFY